MNIWNRFYFKDTSWCSSKLEFHWVADQIDGILYAGVTVLGRSFIYSDTW